MSNRERAIKALDKDKGDDEITSGQQGENARLKKNQQEHKQLSFW